MTHGFHFGVGLYHFGGVRTLYTLYFLPFFLAKPLTVLHYRAYY